MRGRLVGAALLGGLLAAGCGYRLAGGGSGVLPPTVRIVAVTTFENRTARTEIEQRVTEEVAREFSRRGRYKVVTDPAGADADRSYVGPRFSGARLRAFVFSG